MNKRLLLNITALVALFLSPIAIHAGTTWDGGGGADANWTTAANWNGDTLPAFDGTDAIVFGTPSGLGTNTLLNGNKIISSLTISTTTAFAISGDTLTLQSGNITKSVDNDSAQVINSGIVLGNNGNWTSSGRNIIVNGPVGDGGNGYSLTFTGARPIYLNGSNTYTGTTFVNNSGGVVFRGSNATSAVTIGTGALMIGNNYSIGSGPLTINGGSIAAVGPSTITLNNAVTANASFSIANASVFTQQSLVFNGPFTLGNSLTMTANAAGASQETIFNRGVGDGGNGYNLSLDGSRVFDFMGTNSYTGATTITTATVRFRNSNATANVTLNSGTLEIYNEKALGNGTFTINGGNITPGGTITLANPVAIGGSFTRTVNSGGKLIFAGLATLKSSPTIAINSGSLDSLEFTGGITEDGTSRSLTFTGANTRFLTITGTGLSQYTGGTTVNSAGGTFSLRIGADDSLPTAGAVTVNTVGSAIGQFNLNGFNQTIGSLIGNGEVALSSGKTLTTGDGSSTTFSGLLFGGGNLTKRGSGTFTLAGNNTYSGATTIKAGTLVISGASGAVANSASLAVNPAGTLSLDNTSANANRISDTASVTLSGRLNVVGNSSADTSETIGALTNGAGASVVTVNPGSGRAGRLAASSLGRSNNGTALFRGTSLGTAAYPAANVANITFTTAPTLQGAGGGAGTTTMSILPHVIGDGSTSGNGSDFITYTANGIRLLNAGAGEYKTSITDGQTQLDNVKLTGGASLSSATTINSLLLGAGGGVSGSATLNLNSGAILAVGGANSGVTVPTLALGASEGVVFALNNLSIGSAITGSGGLTKAGAATLTLSGPSSYTGQTTVNQGTLLFNGTLSSDSSSVVVRDGATLGGSGNIARAVNVDDGGILSPGNSPGTLTVGPLTLTNASVLSFELGPHNGDGSAIVGGGFNDLIEVNGNLTLDGLLDVTALTGFYDFGANPNVYRLINYTGTLTDNTLVLGSFPAGTTGRIDTTIAGQVNLVVIPEPTVAVLLRLGGLLLLRRKRSERSGA